MKKNLIASSTMLLCCLLLLCGCQKEAAEMTVPNNTTTSNLASEDNLHHKTCRLTDIDWGDGTSWHFHYNDQGLADKWINDLGDGLPHNFTLKYDNCGRLIKAFDHYNNTIYTYLFYYRGNRLIKQTWSNNITPDGGEIVNTYDDRGNIVRRDDKVNDIHTIIEHDHLGNSHHFDFYVGKMLYITGDFTFRIPNKNPLLTVSGVDVGFFYYNYGYWDKWWETSDKYVVYDNGTPTVLVDFAPSKTVMNFGVQHYLSSVDYFDRISKSTITNILSYQNCPGGCDLVNAQPLQNKPALSAIRSMRSSLFTGSAKFIKQKIRALNN